MKTVSLFSCGVSSAVATKILLNEIDEIIYTHINDQHLDTMRFLKDCSNWFGKEIKIISSDIKSVEEACFAAGGKGYINGPTGAACTRLLKKKVRIDWEKSQKENIRFVWGLDSTETLRINRILETMPNNQHVFPLADKNICKLQAHEIVLAVV